MKVYIIYDLADAPSAQHHRIALTLPSKWLAQSTDKLLEAFVNNYNKKFPDMLLDDARPATRARSRLLRTPGHVQD